MCEAQRGTGDDVGAQSGGAQFVCVREGAARVDAAALWPLSRTARIRRELAIRRELRSGPRCAARRHSVAVPLLQARRSGLSAPSVWPASLRRGGAAVLECGGWRGLRRCAPAVAGRVHLCELLYYWQEKRILPLEMNLASCSIRPLGCLFSFFL